MYDPRQPDEVALDQFMERLFDTYHRAVVAEFRGHGPVPGGDRCRCGRPLPCEREAQAEGLLGMV